MQRMQTGLIRNPILPGLLAAILIAVGCSEDEKPSATRRAGNGKATPTGSAVTDETWDIIYMQGARVGYTHTTVTEVPDAEGTVVKTNSALYFSVKRYGQQSKPGIRVQITESPEGALIDFNVERSLSATPGRTTGRVVGDRLKMQTETLGKTTDHSIAWSDQFGGPLADLNSLRAKPMKPNERRTLRLLESTALQVATIEMTAQDYEQVDLPSGTRKLLRIGHVLRYADGKWTASTMWCDFQGDVLRRHLEGGVETLRGTKELALAKTDNVKLDLGLDLAVKVGRALPNPHATKRLRYRVQLKENDPAKVFASGPSQRVKSVDPHVAEITVYALRPGRPGGNPDAPNDPPTDGDRQPSNMIQSDFPKIVAIARQAAGDETDPWQAALKLERYVHGYIKNVNFTQAFATAAEVADKPVGDCSEHAMLLAAVARARGIPARVAMGLVYLPGKRAFGYHMWTEMYVDDRWTALDATLGQGGIGAAHLKLSHSNFKDDASLLSLLPLIKVIGQLEIEIIEVE